MTRPDQHRDDWTMQPPADPWATIDRPVPTVYLGNPDTTAHAGPAHPAAPAGPSYPTVPAGPAHPTVPAAGPGPAATVHLGATAPTVRAAEELRFGPGVPAAAPAWPAARRRPPWRRLVSVLSSLLTVVLVAVVGLYLWQQLRPLEVEGVTVAVPRPAGNRCDVTVDVVATVRTNGRSGVISYQWFRSGKAPGGVLTEQVGSGQRAATLTLRWTFSGVGSTTETATVNIIEPNPAQAGTKVAYRCRRG